jgi:hypothetical protein
VIKGRLKFAFADGNEELSRAGDAYYAAPGHVPTLYAGTDVVEFSPTAELQKTLEVVTKTWWLESADDGQAAINANVGQSSSSGTAETVTAPSCAFITGIQNNPGNAKRGVGERRWGVARIVTAVHCEARGEPPQNLCQRPARGLSRLSENLEGERNARLCS